MQDATVQSTPPTSQPQAVAAPSSYAPTPAQVAPAPQAAPVAYQVGMNYPQAVPAAAPSYQSSPTQYAPQSQPVEAPQSNPWESAFNKVMGVLSTPVQSPLQGQQYPQTSADQYTPANYGQQTSPTTTPSAPQTWQANQVSSINSSPTSSTASSPDPQAMADALGMSQESRQVMDAFGIEAPAILNKYAVNLEGLVDGAVQWAGRATDNLNRFANFSVNSHKENLAYNEILTNPDVLSDYTLKFFGPQGPHPVYENEAQLEQKGYPTRPVAQNNAQAAAAMPAPPASAPPQQPENFWGTFNEQMARDPQNAWKVLNQAAPQTVQNKLFVME